MTTNPGSSVKCATCDFFIGAGRTIESSGRSVRHEMNGYGNCQVDGKNKRQQVNSRCEKYKNWRMIK